MKFNNHSSINFKNNNLFIYLFYRILLFISCLIQNSNPEGCTYKSINKHYQPPVKQGAVATRVLFTNFAKSNILDSVPAGVTK